MLRPSKDVMTAKSKLTTVGICQNMGNESSQDVVWNAYIDKYNSEPATAQQLLNFSKFNNVTPLSFSNARKTFNRNKGSSKIDIVTSQANNKPSSMSPNKSKQAPTKSSSANRATELYQRHKNKVRANTASSVQITANSNVEPFTEHKSDDTSIDLSIFNQSHSILQIIQCPNIIHCASISRIINASIYHQSLLRRHSKSLDGLQIFGEFIDSSYAYFLNDIIHLISGHAHDIEEIHNLMMKQSNSISCDINHCLITDRHCGIDDGQNGNIQKYKNHKDGPCKLYCQIFDNIHYYIVHIFEMGLREKKQDLEIEAIKMEQMYDDGNDAWNCTDFAMKRRADKIQQLAQKLSRFRGRSRTNINKFTIQSQSASAQINESMSHKFLCVVI